MAQTTEVKFKLGAEDQTAQAFNAILDRLDSVDKSAKKATSSFGSLGSSIGSAFAGISAGAVIRQIVTLSDTFTNLTSRLGLVVAGTQNLNAVQQDLFDISQQTRNPLEATTDIYTRLARSSQHLGVSQGGLLAVTSALSKALIISGGGAQSTSAAMIQLAQGLQSGQLRGQELNSVLEQTPRVAQAIADGLKMTTGQLRDYAEKGKLSAEEVIGAILSQKDVIDREFSRMPTTVGQAIQTVNNSITQFIGNVDKTTGASYSLASIIQEVANKIGNLHNEIKGAEPALVSTIAAITAFATSGAVIAGIGAIAAAIGTISAPILLVSGAVATLVAGLTYLSTSKVSKQQEDALSLLQGVDTRAEDARLMRQGRNYIPALSEEEKKNREKVDKMILELQDKTNEILYGKQKVYLDEVRKLGGESAVKAAQEQFDIQNAYQVAKERAAMKNKDYEAAEKAFRDNQLADIVDKQKLEDKNQKAQDKSINYLNEFKSNLDAINDRIALKNDGIFRTNEELLIESSRLDLSAKLYETIRKVKNLDNLTEEQKIKKEQELTDEYNKQLERIKEIAKQRKIDQADFMKGVGIGIKKYRDEIADVSNLMEDSVVGALRGIEDAFVKFVETGKLSFKGLANAIISDLIRINVRQNIMTPLSAALGGMFGTTYGQLTTGSGVANQFNPDVNYRAMGGPVTAGQPYIVGEQGPELFMPSSSGTIIPNGQSGSSVVVNQTINVTTGVQQTVRAEVMNMLPQIANAAKSAVAEAKLRGGSFAAAMR